MLKQLEWDSKFWGFPVAHLDVIHGDLPSIHKTKLDQYSVVQTLVDLSRSYVSQYLVQLGFFPVDTRVGYELSADTITANSIVLPNLRFLDGAAIDSSMYVFASVLSDNSRFTAFPTSGSQVTKFYETWISNAQQKIYDDGIIIAFLSDKPIGLVTYRENDHQTSIGLLAVHPKHQGIGVAKSLVSRVIDRMGSNNSQTLSVVTEGSNIAAQRFYQKFGFRITTEKLWMYRTHE